MVSPNVTEVTGTHVKRQPTIMVTAPDQRAIGTGLVDLAELVVEKTIRTLVVPGAALKDPSASPAHCSTPISSTAMEPILQIQIYEVSQEGANQSIRLRFQLMQEALTMEAALQTVTANMNKKGAGKNHDSQPSRHNC